MNLHCDRGSTEPEENLPRTRRMLRWTSVGPKGQTGIGEIGAEEIRQGLPLLILMTENPAVLSNVGSHLLKDRRRLLQHIALCWPWGGRVEKWKDESMFPRVFASDQQGSHSIG